MSKITSITTQLVPIPLPSPIVARGGTLDFKRVDNLVVHVDTEDGIRGSSYVWLPGAGVDETIAPPAAITVVEHMVHAMADLVVGKSVFQYERVWTQMLGRTGFLGRGIVSLAHSGLDMAIWDAMCKLLGQPLFRLLGSHSEQVPFYSNQLLDLWDAPIPKLKEEAARLLELGYTDLKMPGGLHPLEADDWDLQRAAAVREVIGPGIGLMVDVGGRWAPDRLVRLASRVDELKLRWFEDPVSLDEPDLLLRIRQYLKSPIGTGENSFDIRQLRTWIERGCLDVVIFEPMRIGGVTGALKLAAICEAHGIPMAPHTYPELAAQLMSAKPAGVIGEYLSWWRPMLEEPIEIVRGKGTPSSRPGIGIHFDKKFLERFPSRSS